MTLHNRDTIACVTGASGMIGSRLTYKLLDLGYKVRALSRNSNFSVPGVEIFYGSLVDDEVLSKFLNGACILFHAAGEISDIRLMWETNVIGAERLMNAIRNSSSVKFVCFISSAGVIGKSGLKIIHEDCACNPQNLYELTKLEAEKVFSKSARGINVYILRPTNVVDENHLGDLSLPISNTKISFMKAFVKGGECAHLVHADDVANAAMFFIDSHASHDGSKIFFVSMDGDDNNSILKIWNIYKEYFGGKIKSLFFHLPLFVPYLIRRVCGNNSNYGNVRYSSEKLLQAGFEYHFDVRAIIKDIAIKRSSIS
jgi:nucleoside-diphosphate-sugar epimerase